MGVTSAVQSPSNYPKQLSDGNALGTFLGNGPTDLIGFYQVAQPNVPGGIAQPVSQGSLYGVAGTVTVASVTVTATSVAPNTSAEQTFTLTGAASGQVIAVQKPTTDAGIAIVGVRAGSSNTVGITYANDTAATITPTATQTYTFEIIPASMTISATLTPAAVAPNTTAEQIFAVNGIGSGTVVVNKPSAQAGLGIVDARVVSPGNIGITYANFTAATITPTAGESYLFFAAPAVAIAPVFYTVTAALNPTTVAGNTAAEQTFTVPGIPANAQVVVNKPSLTTGLGLGGARVSAANTVAINFVNNTSASIDPPLENYSIGVFPAAAPAAGSSTTYNSQFGAGNTADHAALVALGLIAGP
jgi:hypothetical protein